MTRIILTIVCLVLLFACKQENTAISNKVEDEIIKNEAGQDISDKIRIPISAFGPLDTIDMPQIKFTESFFDFDTITEGTIIEHIFEFENTGKSKLYILDARLSCGCTVASYPKDAIDPNEKGEINVTFDSRNKLKYQNKNIIIITNTYPNETTISLRGFVKEKNN